MNSRKTLKSVSVDGLKPTIMLTPVIEPRGEGYRIHHIKSFSIARDGRDTFVPLRHVSKQKRRIFELEDENAKLREELAKARDPQRIGGQADPSSFVYAIEQLREFRWQHATNDEDAIPYINKLAAAHERENAKLRKLARGMYGILATFDAILGNHDACETPRPLIFGENKSFKDVMRELGIEVDG